MTRLEKLISAAQGEGPVPIHKSYLALCLAALITSDAQKYSPLDADEAAAIEELLADLEQHEQ